MTLRLFAYVLIAITPVLWVLGAWALDFWANEIGMHK